MNLRSEAILSALNYVSFVYSDQPLNIVEVGCMFKENEGLSTYIIADFLAKRLKGGRFVSIEYAADHIEASKKIIETKDSSLKNQIEYKHGHSLSILPEVLSDFGKVHFFSLDGGAHPEVCLHEFEISTANLAPEGVILVDDAQYIEPSKAYSLPRYSGKATFILPMLVFANYLKNRKEVREANSVEDDERSIPNSYFINQMERIDFSNVNCSNFVVIGKNHQILVYSSPSFISEITKLTHTPIIAISKDNTKKQIMPKKPDLNTILQGLRDEFSKKLEQLTPDTLVDKIIQEKNQRIQTLNNLVQSKDQKIQELNNHIDLTYNSYSFKIGFFITRMIAKRFGWLPFIKRRLKN